MTFEPSALDHAKNVRTSEFLKSFWIFTKVRSRKSNIEISKEFLPESYLCSIAFFLDKTKISLQNDKHILRPPVEFTHVWLHNWWHHTSTTKGGNSHTAHWHFRFWRSLTNKHSLLFTEKKRTCRNTFVCIEHNFE